MIKFFSVRRQKLPEVRVPRAFGDKILEAMAVLLLLGIWVVAFILYNKAPDVIPTHINIYGKADRIGSKDTLLVLAGIATFVMALTGYRSFFPSRMSRFPVQITEENMLIQYALIVRYLRVVNVLVGMLLVNMLFSLSDFFLSIGNGIFEILMVIIVALLLLSAVIYNILARKYR
nr:DUF1648 domain-containing protein [uncultured Bacteroides sp.]